MAQRSAVLAPYRLILQSTLYPLNLGSVARAAANFDVRDIALVAPRCDFNSTDNFIQRDAFAMATGPARDFLLGARRCGTLAEALEGCDTAVAFTARSSRARVAVAGEPMSLPAVAELPELAALLADEDAADASDEASLTEPAQVAGQVALVFGPEDNGLQQEELALCSHSCALPTAAVMSSLNLSHAVAVVLARLYDERLVKAETLALVGAAASAPEVVRASGAGASAETHAIVSAVVATLQRAFSFSMDLRRLGGLLGPLRDVLLRAAPTEKEARVLFALARHVARLGGDTDRMTMKSDPTRHRQGAKRQGGPTGR